MSLESILQSIEPVIVNESEMRSCDREAPFFRLAFDLMRETSQWVCLFASVNYSVAPTWNVRQAILGGHFVRLFKLNRLLLDNVNERRGELIWVLLRAAAECVINVRYILANPSDETFSSYLQHSLQYERDLLRRIEKNIEARGGAPLPIEERMRRSIIRTFDRSQLSVDSLPKKRIRDWAGKNLFQKAESLGLDQAYFAIIGGPSRNVHGGWRDLLEHHLRCEVDGQFTPDLEFSALRRPQPLFAIASMTVPALDEYSQFLGAPELERVRPLLLDLHRRIAVADELHEEYLERRPNRPLNPSAAGDS
jgi:hypothetical protein